MIGEYNSRALSVEEDALNAATALLRQFKMSLFSEGFYFGLPTRDFPVSLSWQCKLGRYWEYERRRPCFPSWSWAGWRTSGFLQYTNETFPLTQPELSVWQSNGQPFVTNSTVSNGEVGSESRVQAFFCDFNKNLKETASTITTPVDQIPRDTHITVQGVLIKMKFMRQPHSPAQLCSSASWKLFMVRDGRETRTSTSKTTKSQAGVAPSFQTLSLKCKIFCYFL